MTAAKIIANGWPVEYAGPRTILSNHEIPWAGRPEIIARPDGKWMWQAHAFFLAEDAIDDLKALADDGWRVRVTAGRKLVRIRIEEQENP